MKLIANLDQNRQAYLMGYVCCSQFQKAKPVRFYLDSGCTVTTLLDIDVVRLGLKWNNLSQTECDTAAGKAFPYMLLNPKILLKTESSAAELKEFSLNVVHLLPPDDPTRVYPVQYEFAFSLLGMDVLSHFSSWKYDYSNNIVILTT